MSVVVKTTLLIITYTVSILLIGWTWGYNLGYNFQKDLQKKQICLEKYADVNVNDVPLDCFKYLFK